MPSTNRANLAFVKIPIFVQYSKTAHKIITVLKYPMIINTVTALVVNIVVHLIVSFTIPKFRIVNDRDELVSVNDRDDFVSWGTLP